MAGESEGKERRAREILRSCGGALVSYSGGVDSTLLAVLAREELGERMVAVHVSSPLQSPRERERAVELAAGLGLPLEVAEVDELSVPGLASNPPDRCYLCKRHRLEELARMAWEKGFAAVLDGSNADDTSLHRPGRRALAESGALCPLEEAGMTKAEVRELARVLGLPNWDQPPRPCLATRFPYGAELSPDLLRRVDEAEAALEALGVRQARVRLDDPGTARLEIAAAELPTWEGEDARERLAKKLGGAGFRRILLDLDGYHSGAMDAGGGSRRCVIIWEEEGSS